MSTRFSRRETYQRPALVKLNCSRLCSNINAKKCSQTTQARRWNWSTRRVAGAFSVPVTALVMYAFLFEIIRNLDEPEVKVLKRADYRFSDLKLYHLSYRSGFLPSCIAFVHR